MHFAFIPWGARQEVERLFRDMEAQKFQLKLWKEGETDKGIWINGQVRLLPFGVVEYIFPRECRDLVLATLIPQKANRFGVPKLIQTMFNKALKLKPIPKKYKENEKLLWCCEHVSIMPIGIREDTDLIETKDMGYKDWYHEAL